MAILRNRLFALCPSGQSPSCASRAALSDGVTERLEAARANMSQPCSECLVQKWFAVWSRDGAQLYRSVAKVVVVFDRGSGTLKLKLPMLR